MSNYEIQREYEQAADKVNQIEVLAGLNALHEQFAGNEDDATDCMIEKLAALGCKVPESTHIHGSVVVGRGIRWSNAGNSMSVRADKKSI